MADEGTPAEGAAQEEGTAAEAPATGDEQVNYKDRAEAQQKVNRDLERKLKAAQGEIDKARQAGMSEAEKAIAEAEVRGRTAASVEFGKRLARTQFDAAAGRRNPDVDTVAVLEYVDLARFVGDDGEPDGKAIQAAVDRLVPAPPGGPPSFDGGTRTTSPAPAGMTALIRKAAGRA